MKFSVSSYSYNQYLSAGKMTQLDAVREAARQGFDGIEFTELFRTKGVELSFEEQIERRVCEQYLAAFPHLEGKFSVHFCHTADGVNLKK